MILALIKYSAMFLNTRPPVFVSSSTNCFLFFSHFLSFCLIFFSLSFLLLSSLIYFFLILISLFTLILNYVFFHPCLFSSFCYSFSSHLFFSFLFCRSCTTPPLSFSPLLNFTSFNQFVSLFYFSPSLFSYVWFLSLSASQPFFARPFPSCAP